MGLTVLKCKSKIVGFKKLLEGIFLHVLNFVISRHILLCSLYGRTILSYFTLLNVVFQCKITVPKMGSIHDLCTTVSGLLKVAPDKVVMCYIFFAYFFILLYSFVGVTLDNASDYCANRQLP